MIKFIQNHVFYMTFMKDVVIICLFSLSNSVIKFVSKCYVVLLVNVIGILSERFVEFTFYFTRFGDVDSAPIFLQYVGFW